MPLSSEARRPRAIAPAVRWFRASLTIAGAVALLAAAGHFAWQPFQRTYDALAGASEAQWRWLTILNLSVGLLLALHGAVTLLIARWRAADLALLRVLSAALVVFWCVRFAYEVALPVPIPFLVLEAPSTFFEVLIGGIVAILAAPELALRAGLLRP